MASALSPESKIITTVLAIAQRDARRRRGLSTERQRRELAELGGLVDAWEATLPPLGDAVSVSDMSAAEAAFTLWRVIVADCRARGASVATDAALLTPAMEAEMFGLAYPDALWRVSCRSGPDGWACDLLGGLSPFSVRLDGLGNGRRFRATVDGEDLRFARFLG